jgi:hypothetical protein
MVERTTWPAVLVHTAAIFAALVVFAVILTYTGSANLLFAIIGGFGTGLLIYLMVHTLRDASGKK